jgi:hypothetical protein
LPYWSELATVSVKARRVSAPSSEVMTYDCG